MHHSLLSPKWYGILQCYTRNHYIIKDNHYILSFTHDAIFDNYALYQILVIICRTPLQDKLF